MTSVVMTKPVTGEDDRLAVRKRDAEYALRTIISHLDELYPRWEELCQEADTERFCTDCPYIVVVGDVQEFWGASCLREYPHCKAEFDPTDGNCHRKKEYAEILKEKEELQAKIEKLDALLEILETEEGVRG